MSAENDVRRLREELARIRQDIARESAKIGPARERAAKARDAAAKSTSTSTSRMRRDEADREEAKAYAAEKKRAELETRAARVESELFKAQTRLDQERARLEKQRADAQKRALAQLRADASQRQRQFEPASLLSARQAPRVPIQPTPSAPAKDVFLSHASEDKDEIARPLADALEARGVSVWYDELEIRVGMSIRRAIDRGIANCRYGLVILSSHFFVKPWTQAELDALFGRQLSMDGGEGFILPIWHKVSRDEVAANVPMLAGLHALNTMTYSVDDLAERLATVILVSRHDEFDGSPDDAGDLDRVSL